MALEEKDQEQRQPALAPAPAQPPTSQAMQLYQYEEGAPRASVRPLTPRELEIARLITAELSDKEIAQRLGLKFGTVKAFVQLLLRKLNCTTRVGICKYIMTLDQLELAEQEALARKGRVIEPATDPGAGAGTVAAQSVLAIRPELANDNNEAKPSSNF